MLSAASDTKPRGQCGSQRPRPSTEQTGQALLSSCTKSARTPLASGEGAMCRAQDVSGGERPCREPPPAPRRLRSAGSAQWGVKGALFTENRTRKSDPGRQTRPIRRRLSRRRQRHHCSRTTTAVARARGKLAFLARMRETGPVHAADGNVSGAAASENVLLLLKLPGPGPRVTQPLLAYAEPGRKGA